MNLTKLNNITPFEVNNTLINQSNEIVPNLISNSNTVTDGYFGLGIQLVIFIFLLIVFMADQEVFRFRFPQALVASSGITLLVGIIMLISNISSSFLHLMWFAIIFATSLVIIYYDR